MTKGKFIAIILTAFILFNLFTGCSVIKYGAALYSHADEWIDEAFQKENKVKDAYYINENFIHGVSDPEEEEIYIMYSTAPSERIFIITEVEEYNRLFSVGIEEFGVNFDNQMLIVYTFTDTTRKNRQLVDMNVKDGILEITYKKEKPINEYFAPVGDTCMPYQRWFVVKMDKLAVNSVVFEEK